MHRVMLRGGFKTPEATVGQECPTYNDRRMGILARRLSVVLKQILKHNLPNRCLSPWKCHPLAQNRHPYPSPWL